VVNVKKFSTDPPFSIMLLIPKFVHVYEKWASWPGTPVQPMQTCSVRCAPLNFTAMQEHVSDSQNTHRIYAALEPETYFRRCWSGSFSTAGQSAITQHRVRSALITKTNRNTQCSLTFISVGALYNHYVLVCTAVVSRDMEIDSTNGINKILPFSKLLIK